MVQLRDRSLVIQEGVRQLYLTVDSPSIIRVRYGNLDECTRPTHHLVAHSPDVLVQSEESSTHVRLSTSQLLVEYEKESGLLSSLDGATGHVLLRESARRLRPVHSHGETAYELEQAFKVDPSEFFSGTGFQQDDLVDFNGRYAYLCQWNTSSVVPFLQSNRGWGFLWNNTSLTELNPDPVPLPIKPSPSAESTCRFEPTESGRYHFSLRRKTDEPFGKLFFAVDDAVLLNKRPAWDPMVFTTAVDLEAGKAYTIRSTGNFGVAYHPPSARETLVVRSELGQALDYHFIAGQSADERIAGYRLVTGGAPMFPKWAYGFFQSRERYGSAEELLDVVQQFRTRHYPLDCVVQDWQYWGRHGWNAIQFDDETFPDMAAAVATLHKHNTRLMISVWPNFGDPEGGCQEMLTEFGEQGWLLKRNPSDDAPPERLRQFWSGYVDVMNEAAGEALWARMNQNLFQVGVDAWWLDGSEPNLDGYQGGLRHYATSQGPGAYWLNLYPLKHSTHVHNGQRDQDSSKRVFILGRTAFAGIQRLATTVWSGDTWADWDTFRRQIVAGITCSYSGVPYWCADIGGFSGLDNTSPAHREMYTRWFQFGAFSPIFRAHGTSCEREPWCFGSESERIQVRYLELRYRLFPYIYSEAAAITQHAGTMMRGLLMDFPDDPQACRSGSSYMFGSAFLVSPVTQSQTRHPPVVPSGALLDANGQPGGLSAAYYNGVDFDQLVQQGKDAVIDFVWNDQGMEHLEAKVDGTIEGLNSSRFAARWSGYVKIERSGEYEFITETHGGVRLWMDGRLVIDNWDDHTHKTDSARLKIATANAIPVTLEYFANGPAGSVGLYWSAPDQDVVPEVRWPVYLPKGSDWYNFWTGRRHAGGQTVMTEAPLDILPLHVRAGSIIPLGPNQEWTGQKPADEIELRIYPGADGSFTLYDDEGDNYRYEDGLFATINVEWIDSNRTLVISDRDGAYPGMLPTITFNIVCVGLGDAAHQHAAKRVTYTGSRTETELYQTSDVGVAECLRPRPAEATEPEKAAGP